MKTQLIVCDRVEFNPERRQHRLGHVLNWIEVPAFPCVVDLAVFIKIHHLDLHEQIAAHIQAVDDQDRLVAYTNEIVLRNFRDQDQIPGVDTYVDIQAVVSIPGNIAVHLYIDDQLYNSCPVTIRQRRDEIG